MPKSYTPDLINGNALAIINKFMIFNRLAPEDLKAILSMDACTVEAALDRVACVQKFGPGETVISEGDYGGCSFWVVKGIFDVIQDGIHIASLSTPGEVFGEMSIFEKIPRVATVRAVTEGICLCLDMSVVDRLENGRVKRVIQEEFAAIMLDRLEKTRQWLEDERQRIDDKYAELLASKKRLQDRLVKKN
jgi:CRP/FNR family cyclic AMP-dependent transcriptional regulator